MAPASFRQWRSIVVAFVCCLLVAVTAVVYTNHLQRVSDRRWCSLLGTLTGVYERNPPPTEDGRRVAAEIAKQYDQLGCPTAGTARPVTPMEENGDEQTDQ